MVKKLTLEEIAQAIHQEYPELHMTNTVTSTTLELNSSDTLQTPAPEAIQTPTERRAALSGWVNRRR